MGTQPLKIEFDDEQVKRMQPTSHAQWRVVMVMQGLDGHLRATHSHPRCACFLIAVARNQ